MTRIKICGLKRPEDIACVNQQMPDYIGFVFAERSKRAVTPAQAAALKAQLHENIKAVGVFVDTPVEFMASLVEAGILDVIQLHGHETNQTIAALRQKTDAPIIQAFRIASAADVRVAEQSAADFVLLDHGAGGTGEAFDWSLISGLSRPFFLAGGLTPENVAQAIAQVHPYGVDTSSGVEGNGGKDPEKIKKFIAQARAD